MGYVPYGRVGVVPVTSDGTILRPLDSDVVASSADGLSADWSMTVFAAVQDAARGEFWPPLQLASASALETSQTQTRRCLLAARLLGLLTEEPRQLITVACALSIPTLKLLDAQREVRRHGRWRLRARAILGPLAELDQAGGLARRVLHAGSLVGAWGPAHIWDRPLLYPVHQA